MGGPIGAMSTKFILHGGMLILSVRVEMRPVSATLDPSLPVTVVSADLAARIGLATGGDEQTVSRNRVVGIDHSEVRLRRVRVGPVGGPAPLAIGADLLGDMPLLLDFSRNRLRVPGHAEYRNIVAHMRAIPVKTSGDGCLSFRATTTAGSAIGVALQGELPVLFGSDRDLEVVAAGVRLHGYRQTSGQARCSLNGAVVTWDAFGGSLLLLDLPHGQIWVPNR